PLALPSLCPPLPSPTLFPYTTLFRSLGADQRLDPPRDVALSCRRAVGAEQVFAKLPRRRRAALALAANDIFGQALTDDGALRLPDRKSTRLNSSHLVISYAVFCLKKK